jgi:hypothetical protein
MTRKSTSLLSTYHRGRMIELARVHDGRTDDGDESVRTFRSWGGGFGRQNRGLRRQSMELSVW